MSHVTGIMIVDAPASALNNAGKNDEARTDNAVAVKFIRAPGGRYPYVSAATMTLVPLFSNPQLTYSYRADGTARETSIRLGSETADCVRAMTNNAPHLAGLNDRRAEPLGEPPEQAPQVADLTDGAEAKAIPEAGR